mgnify:CR=1 FL=1
MLARNSGHVVTIASAAGIVGISKMTDYCASKHAAVGFDESLRLELRRQAASVVTTVVCPFYISTGMFAGVRTRFPAILPILDPERVTDQIVDAIRTQPAPPHPPERGADDLARAHAAGAARSTPSWSFSA